MKSTFLLKMLVAVMTLSLVIGSGFIVYGLVQKPDSVQSSVRSAAVVAIPIEANFLSYHFHGDTITILYSCGDGMIFYSIYKDGRKNVEYVRRTAPKPYDDVCSLER